MGMDQSHSKEKPHINNITRQTLFLKEETSKVKKRSSCVRTQKS